jgi:two-component system sensor histidine kinase ResE
LAAILAVVILSDAAAAWAVNDRLTAGARREAEDQARAQAAQVRALFTQRAGTLAAEAEAVSLYPAVIAAIAGGNNKPLLQWSADVAALQGTRVTVVDATGKVVARGQAPQKVGDNLAGNLAGLRAALAGQKVSGVEAGDELGLALRGYAPSHQSGAVVGAVMIADSLDDQLAQKLVGAASPIQAHVVPGSTGVDESCDVLTDASAATCRFSLASPGGPPAATVSLTVPLAEVAQARDAAQRTLWLTGGIVLLAGIALAWLLARSLTRPLATLTVAAEDFGRGQYDRVVDVRGTDEIGVLARELDSMRHRIASTTAALRNERDVLGAVLESTEDGIILVDWEGAPIVANGRWTELAGDTGLAVLAELSRVGGDGKTFAETTRSWLADHDRVVGADFEQFTPYRRFRCYSAPVHSRERQAALGRIIVLRDVTRESEAERMRGALVATVSHELRSPLTAIAGYTDTLLSGGPWDDGTTREFLDIVAQSARKLGSLVDNLLDAAKMEAGVLSVEREPVRLERLARQVVAQRQPLVPDHALGVEADDELPLVEADPLRIEQVIGNLVDNAIKYSPEGGPIAVHAFDRGDGFVALSVSDRGIGIAPSHLEQLFQRFYRVDSSLARTTRGVGLGLFICKGIVEAHGGRIDVTSEPGVGSTFTFTLPRLVVVDEAVISAPSAAGEALRLVSRSAG